MKGRKDNWNSERTFHGRLDVKQKMRLELYLRKSKNEAFSRVHEINALCLGLGDAIACNNQEAALRFADKLLHVYDFEKHHKLMRRFYGSDWGIAYLRDASFVYAQAGQWENFKICTDTWKEGLRRNKHRFTALVSFTRLVNMRVQSRSLQSMHPDSVVEHDSYVRNVLGDPRVVSWYESLRKRIAKMDSILSAIASLDVDIYCCATCLGPGDNQCDESIAMQRKKSMSTFILLGT